MKLEAPSIYVFREPAQVLLASAPRPRSQLQYVVLDAMMHEDVLTHQHRSTLVTLVCDLLAWLLTATRVASLSPSLAATWAGVRGKSWPQEHMASCDEQAAANTAIAREPEVPSKAWHATWNIGHTMLAGAPPAIALAALAELLNTGSLFVEREYCNKSVVLLVGYS